MDKLGTVRKPSQSVACPYCMITCSKRSNWTKHFRKYHADRLPELVDVQPAKKLKVEIHGPCGVNSDTVESAQVTSTSGTNQKSDQCQIQGVGNSRDVLNMPDTMEPQFNESPQQSDANLVSDLQTRLDNSESRLFSANQLLASQSLQLEKQSAAISDSKLSHDNEVATLQHQLTRYQSHIETNETLLSQSEKLVDSLRTQNHQLVEDKHRVEVALSQSILDCKGLRENLVGVEAKVELLTKDLDTSNLEKLDLQSSSDTQAKLVKQLETLNDDLRNVNEALKQEICFFLETELSCSVCSFVYDNATITRCGHVFCQFCVEKWVGSKKDCPYCRAPIQETKQLIRVRDYQALLDGIFKIFGPEFQKIRADELASKRKAQRESERLQLEADLRRRGIHTITVSDDEDE